MPQNYSLNGRYVSKEVYEKAKGINQPTVEVKVESKVEAKPEVKKVAKTVTKKTSK